VKTRLLDVNALIALMDPLHIHHDAAHAWFGALSNAWATCPLTENAVVRILSNPSYPSAELRPEEAVALLDRFLERAPRHAFWPDAVSLRDGTVFDRAYLQGHRQIADVYLAGLAHRQGGVLATFDRTIPVQAIRGASRDLIEIIAA
jgi:hypothetical protein